MLKTRKLVSLVLVVALVLSMGIFSIVSAHAEGGSFYLIGSFCDWDAASADQQFEENSDNPGEYMLLGVSLNTGDGIKVIDKDSSTWYPDGMGNEYVVPEGGQYNIYFNPAGNAEWSDFGGYIYVEAAGDPEPATEEEQTEPATEEEQTEEPAPQTDEPAPATEAPAEGDDAQITIDGTTVNAHVDDEITYTYSVNMAGLPTGEGGKVGKITEVDLRLQYDAAHLQLLSSIEGVENDDGVVVYEVAPNLKSGNIMIGNPEGELNLNATQLSGWNFSSEKVLLTAKFKVKAAGAAQIFAKLQALGSGDVQMVKEGVVYEAPNTKPAYSVYCPHGEPATEAPATEAPATEAPVTEEPATSAGGDGKAVVTIEDWSGTTDTKEFNVGDTFSVISYLKVPEGKRVNSINIWQTFNDGDACVKLTSDVNAVDDPEADNPVSLMFPLIKGLTANVEGNVIKANGSAAKYLQAMRFVNDDSILIKADYEVIAAGTTKIKTDIITMATIMNDDSMENQIMASQKVGNDTLSTRTVFDNIVSPEPATEEPATEEPATEEPATEAPIKGNTYYLTGSIAGWGAKAEYEFQPDGEGQYKLTGIALTTTDMIKGIKTSKSGDAISDWYPDGMDNNIAVTQDSTYTVIFRPAGDGTAEDGFIYSWMAGEEGYEVGGGTNHYGYLFKLIDENAEPTTDEPATEAPVTDAPVTDEPATEAPVTDEPATDAPATEEPGTDAPVKPGLWVVADGNWYEVESGKEYDYVYYLNTGEKVCSLDAETLYDTEGLKWNKKMVYSEDDEMDVTDMADLFPVIKDAMILNDNVAGRLKYNFSAANGKNFKTDDAQLIHMNFTVTAEEGVYYINTALHTVAGADEHKYIFKDEILDELKKAEGELVGLTPSDDHPEDPTTEPATEEPATEAPVTDAPATDAPATDAPATDAPATEAPATDAPATEAPATEAPATEAPATEEPATEAPAIPAYTFEKESYDFYKADSNDLVMVVHNDVDDTKTFGNFLGMSIEGVAVPEDAKITYAEGSLIITVAAADVPTYFADGANNVIAYFADDDGEYEAYTIVNVLEGNAPTEAPTDSDATAASPSNKSTIDDSSSNGGNGYSVQTGSTEMSIIFLVILVMAAGVVIFMKKKKFD